jgi:hypothetical protein
MGWIVGIEKVETSFVGTSASVTLTEVGDNGYDGYLVPFATFATSGVTTSAVSPHYVDVYFSGTPGNVSINFQRGESSGTCYVTCYVIEVDTNEVTVQSGTFQLVSVTSDTSTITEVDTSKAFHIQYHRFNYAGNEYFYQSYIRTYFSSTTELTHDRANLSGSINGHWYVIEDQGSNFSVQHADPDVINPATSGEDTISSVDMNKSFVIASHKNYYGARSNYYSAVSVWLKTSTVVRAEQGANSGYPANSIVRAQVITLTDSDAYVERGSQMYANGVGSDADTLSQSLDLDYSIAWIPTLTSCQWVDTHDRNNASFFRAELTNADEITTSRQATDTGAVVKWEAVQFQLPPPPPSIRIIPKGVILRGVIIK